jgi:hypothetical protein
MKLAALTFTRIDGDVLEEFLRHTARFVDHHYLGIMGSADSALAIAEALVVEGLPITIWRLSNRASLEGDPRMTGPFARLIFERLGCEYLLPLDADEFVLARDRDHLERALEALPPQTHGLADWTTYVPSKNDDASEPRVLARIQHRRKVETPAYAKVFIHRSFAGDPGAVITAGNHLVTGGASQAVALADIRLAHFPVRSLLQLQCKALLGTSAILMAGSETASLGYQWQLAYKRLFARGKDSISPDLSRLAARYLDETEAESDETDFLVHDPLPSVSRAYAVQQPDILELAIGLSFETGRAYGNLRNAIMPPPLNPQAQWPDFEAASGALDEIRIAGSGFDLELAGRIAIPDRAVSVRAAYAILPGEKIALTPAATDPEGLRFRETIDLSGYEAGIYLLRVFAFGDDGRWYALAQTVAFEVSESATIL